VLEGVVVEEEDDPEEEDQDELERSVTNVVEEKDLPGRESCQS
jgi:hypothetical protein